MLASNSCGLITTDALVQDIEQESFDIQVFRSKITNIVESIPLLYFEGKESLSREELERIGLDDPDSGNSKQVLCRKVLKSVLRRQNGVDQA